MENVFLIFGKSFTGKTARMLYELREENRVVLVDPKCSQLTDLFGWEHLSVDYLPSFKTWSNASVVDFLRPRLCRSFRCVVHFRSWHRENLSLLCGLISEVKNLTLAVDELGLFVPPGPANALPSKIQQVVISGSHDGISFLGTSQRPSLVHATVRANAERMLFYRMNERSDLELARNYLSEDVFQKLDSLPDQVCIDWSDRRPPFVDFSLAGALKGLLPENR